ncbi:hypothetical protein C2S52_003798 [Perilla frutescens var. hirtella]|nr:hypothetical protein C2S51_011729 [Perilla frutescens var. frutescens]KAH6793321.1 hypothetical protein C2S52_003798 [Perilla frutescens var. hirtella]
MNESADSFSHEFDYQADFTQFLEEARKNAYKVNSDAITIEEKQLNWEKKKRKSWKSTLFSWLKNDKKSFFLKQPSNSTPLTSKVRRGHVSGPIEGPIGGTSTGRAQRAGSGPLTGLFGSTGRSEKCEVPYMCLGQLNKHKIQSYGPVYLVT